MPAMRTTEQERIKAQTYRRKYPKKMADLKRKYHESLKTAVMNVYTNGEQTCRMCGQGDLDVLTVDHINNDGAKHRRGLKPHQHGGSGLYVTLMREGYPSGFRVLCANCNLKKEVVRRREVSFCQAQ